MLRDQYSHRAFKRFHKKSLKDLESFLEGIYPLGEIYFGGGGYLHFFTGLWIGKQPMTIHTGLFLQGADELICADEIILD